MKRFILPAGLLFLVAGAAAAPTNTRPAGPAPLRTVTHVDLARYIGTWYEIASYPQRFQKGCTATTAVYTLREDGMIQVVNRCNRDSLDGRETIARGRARVVDHESNAKLKSPSSGRSGATIGSSISTPSIATRSSVTRAGSTSGS